MLTTSNKIEPLGRQALAIKKKIDRILNKPCSVMFKFKYLMDVNFYLKQQLEKQNSLSDNDRKVIFALMNRAMREL